MSTRTNLPPTVRPSDSPPDAGLDITPDTAPNAAPNTPAQAQAPELTRDFARALAATHQAAFTLSRPWSADEITQLLQDRFTYLCGTAHCFAIGRVIAGEAELLTIATHPDQQHQGLGRAVMTHWLQEARRRDAQEAFLEVAQDNAPAKALYLSCGFGLAGIRKAYYARPKGTAVDAVLMKRSFD